MKKIVMGLTALALAVPMTMASAPEGAEAAAPRKFANCAAMQKVYKHGVGRRGARDKVARGPRVTTFRVDNALYLANARLDRDRDGIACEKR